MPTQSRPTPHLSEVRRGIRSGRIGVDTGGTFTDCVLVNDDAGTIELVKVPSEPKTPERAVLTGVAMLLEKAALGAERVIQFSHGTTLATNTVIEESGAKVGLLVTHGFRDVVGMGRVRFPDQNDMRSQRSGQLVHRDAIREVSERLSHDGTVVVPLDLDEVVGAVGQLIEERGITALVISFLHSYRNDIHERAAREAVELRFPDLFVCCSSDLWAKPREYERTIVAVMNGYVGDRMRSYLGRFDSGIRGMGIQAPLLVTRSNGGVMSADTAGSQAVYSMLSGPAAGVIGAMQLAASAGFSQIITWDMGGTSLDVAILDGTLRLSEHARVGEYPLFLPTVDVLSVGSGGGSIGRADSSGLLHVGPQSAGSDPGPACYGRGGENATLTDAYVLAGFISPAAFAPAGIDVMPDLAERALARLGVDLGMDAFGAADAMIELTTEQMYAEVMPLTNRYGVDFDDFALFPYGGAGPVHAFLFARRARIDKVVVPLFPGLLCAWGSLIADLRYDVPRAMHVDLVDANESELNESFREMQGEAMDWIAAQGVKLASRHSIRIANMRYKGQSFELEVPLTGVEVRLADMREAFETQHLARFQYQDQGAQVELVGLTVRAVGITEKASSTPSLGAGARTETPAERHRAVHMDGDTRNVRVIERAAMRIGDSYAGPLIIDQLDTTVVVPPEYRVTVDKHWNIIGERCG